MSTTAKITKIKNKMKSKALISSIIPFFNIYGVLLHTRDWWYTLKRKFHCHIRSCQTFSNCSILMHLFDYRFITEEVSFTNQQLSFVLYME